MKCLFASLIVMGVLVMNSSATAKDAPKSQGSR